MKVPCKKCGKYLQVRFETDHFGRVLEIVPECSCRSQVKPKRAWSLRVNAERRRACVCQLCDRPTVGKPKVALYCDDHRAAMHARAQLKHKMKVGNKHQQTFYYRHRKRILAKQRRYYRKREVRQRRNDYKREWRRLNRDKVKAQKRRYALRGNSAEAARRHRIRIENGEFSPSRSRYNDAGERLCLNCDIVVSGRTKLCSECKARK